MHPWMSPVYMISWFLSHPKKKQFSLLSYSWIYLQFFQQPGCMTWRNNQQYLKLYQTRSWMKFSKNSLSVSTPKQGILTARSWMKFSKNSLSVSTPKQGILTAKVGWSTSDLASTGTYIFPPSITLSIWCKMLHFNRATVPSKELCVSTSKQVMMCPTQSQPSHQKTWSSWEKKDSQAGKDAPTHCRKRCGLTFSITWAREHKRVSTSTRKIHLVLAKQQLARSMSSRNSTRCQSAPKVMNLQQANVKK